MDHHIFGGEYLSKKQAKKKFRQDILNSWGHQCAYCGNDLGRSATLDHVHPKMRGGHTCQSNLVACCFACNISKSAHDWIDWYRNQKFWSREREIAIAYWITEDLAV